MKTFKPKPTEAVDKLNSKIQNRAVEELAPLAKLGGDIGELVTKVDTEAKALFEKLSKHYKTFSDKLKKAAAKSANIQLGLQYESANDVTESEEESFTIVFKKPEVKSAGKLYRSIIIGDDDTAATLIPELVKKGVIDFQAHSFSLQTLKNSRVSLGINVIGYNLNDNKNLVSDLVIKVGPDGKLNLIHKSVLSAVSKGPNKARSAMFNLSYGFAGVCSGPKSQQRGFA